MRYDDPARPRSALNGARLQLSGSPLPSITLIEPGEASGSWLACVHAHRGGNRFGYHSGVIRDLAEFSEAFLAGPEEALEKYFGYSGPEAAVTASIPVAGNVPILTDLWGD